MAHVVLCMNVLIKIRNLSQVAMLTPMVLCSTMLRPTAMECNALHTTITKNSTVLSVQSETACNYNFANLKIKLLFIISYTFVLCSGELTKSIDLSH